MNCLIKTLQLESGWYTVYAHPRQRWQMKKCRCPQCGETWQILVPQLKYRIYRIETADRYYPPAWYLSGQVLSIQDGNAFLYLLGGEQIRIPVVADWNQEGMDRIFIREGMSMCVSGQLEKKKVCSKKICSFCGKKLSYWTEQYFLVEQKRKILNKERKRNL